MAQLFFLSLQVFFIMGIMGDFKRDPLNHGQAIAFKPDDLSGILVNKRICLISKSTRICAPIP